MSRVARPSRRGIISSKVDRVAVRYKRGEPRGKKIAGSGARNQRKFEPRIRGEKSRTLRDT